MSNETARHAPATPCDATYTALDDLTHYRPTLKRKLDVVKSSEFVEMEPGLGEYVKVEDVRRLLSAVAVGPTPNELDLAMLVRKLCRKMELSENPLLVAATAPAKDFLKRKGLEGSPLRVSPLAAAPLISEELIKGSSSNPQTEETCPSCKGSGVIAGITGRGPDDYGIEDFECAKCDGTGVVQRVPTSADVPLCDGCAQAWFTERNHLKGDHGCVVCAFLGNRRSTIASSHGPLSTFGRDLVEGAYRKATPAENLRILAARLSEHLSPAEKRELEEAARLLSASATGWIPMKDRQPADFERVLCVNGAGYMTTANRFHKAGGKLEDWNGSDYTAEEAVDLVIGGITHWMPLPTCPDSTDRKSDG